MQDSPSHYPAAASPLSSGIHSDTDAKAPAAALVGPCDRRPGRLARILLLLCSRLAALHFDRAAASWSVALDHSQLRPERASAQDRQYRRLQAIGVSPIDPEIWSSVKCAFLAQMHAGGSFQHGACQ